MEINRADSRSSNVNVGPADWLTGAVRIEPVIQVDGGSASHGWHG